MKYINAEGVSLFIETCGVSEKGTHYCVAVDNPKKDRNATLAAISPTTDKVALEVELKKYADENGYELEIVHKIRTEERVLQGNLIKANDFIKLTAEEVRDVILDYFECEKEIDAIKTKCKVDCDNIKVAALESIQDVEEKKAICKESATTGIKKIEVDASWERDIDNAMMLLIRHDTLTILQVRAMDATELQSDAFLDQKEKP